MMASLFERILDEILPMICLVSPRTGLIFSSVCCLMYFQPFPKIFPTVKRKTSLIAYSNEAPHVSYHSDFSISPFLANLKSLKNERNTDGDNVMLSTNKDSSSWIHYLIKTKVVRRVGMYK